MTLHTKEYTLEQTKIEIVGIKSILVVRAIFQLNNFGLPWMASAIIKKQLNLK